MNRIASFTTSRPASGEAPFALSEIFFSRTDDKGVILAANSVFWRVTGYEWQELCGTPHNVVRHPDMPRGVFWLFWDTLKRGKPVGAYVKNKARDGLYYWVFAIAVPFRDGYLSARIKPTSQTRDRIEDAYAALRKREYDEDLSPEDSADLLVAQIKQWGHEDYHHFAAFALNEERTSRDAKLGRAEDKTITRFREMFAAAKGLKSATDDLVRNFEATNIIPHNMRLIAARLEPSGGALSTLSSNYAAMSHEMAEWFEDHVVGAGSNFSMIENNVNDNMCLEAVIRILGECTNQLDGDADSLGTGDPAAERQYLEDLKTSMTDRSCQGLEDLEVEAQRILDACRRMHRFMLGLTTTKSMCNTESAHHTVDVDSLHDVIAQLNDAQQHIFQALAQIEKRAHKIQELAG